MYHTHTITGGLEVEIGLEVFTNDWKWGIIANTDNNRHQLTKEHRPESEHADTCVAWWDVVYPDGTSRQYDCSRLSDRKPVI